MNAATPTGWSFGQDILGRKPIKFFANLGVRRHIEGYLPAAVFLLMMASHFASITP